MNLLNLRIHSFRSYSRLDCSFVPGAIHVLEGANAQGKTNLIEAICFLSNLRSFRTARTEHLVHHGSSGFFLEAVFENDQRKETISVSMEGGKKRLIRFNNPVPSFSSFVGTLNAVLFCPDDLSLFTDSPAARRRFLDTEMVKLSRTYTRSLSLYNRLLKERNHTLKQHPGTDILLDAYDLQLAACTREIMTERASFVQALAEKAGSLYPQFSEGRERLDVEYATFADLETDLESQILDIYAGSRTKDLRMGYTTCGIHKDDLIFLLDGKPVRETASQGQKRSVLLALKLALCLVIEERTGQLPLLLLDDVFSELDQSRKQKLIELLPEGMQVFITAAEPVQMDWKDRRVHFYQVQEGNVVHEPESNGTDGKI